MKALSLGVSVSDYSSLRGHTIPEIYRAASHIEFGGISQVLNDREVAFALQQNPSLSIGRHLVSVQLPTPIDLTLEAQDIRRDLSILKPEYLVTDAMYWNFGGKSERNIWARPCSLSREVSKIVAANSLAIENATGISFYVENAPSISIDGELTIAEFLYTLASSGAHLCFDAGHFWASCLNSGWSIDREFQRLPFEAFGLAHIAGLSAVKYRSSKFYIDNHDVAPRLECVDLLMAFLERAEGVRHLTYEAELASTDVQVSGFQILTEALGAHGLR